MNLLASAHNWFRRGGSASQSAGNTSVLDAADRWFPQRDGEQSFDAEPPPRGSVRFGVHDRVEAGKTDARADTVLGESAALDWPPVEQDDTSDELHESSWWRCLGDAEPVAPPAGRAPGVSRVCVDVRADDPAAVRQALRAAVLTGRLTADEAVELWPIGGWTRDDADWLDCPRGWCDDEGWHNALREPARVDVDDAADGW
jgi:hypothetical protein